MTAHGTATSYTYRRCRCDPCRNAHRIAATRTRLATAVLEPADPRHGTVNGYTNYGCRCDPCKTAQLDQQRAYRARINAIRQATT